MTQAVYVSLKGTGKDVMTNYKSNLLSKLNSPLKYLLQGAMISTTKKDNLYWYYAAAKSQKYSGAVFPFVSQLLIKFPTFLQSIPVSWLAPDVSQYLPIQLLRES